MERPLRFHLFKESLGPRVFRLIAPRAQDGLRISTNRFHDTWHIVCAPHHVRTLRKILWAAAFDNHPGTLFVLRGGVLAPTPFEGARSRPVVIARTGPTHVASDEIRTLLGRMERRKHPDGTVKLRLHGLARAEALGKDEQNELIAREESEHRHWPELRVTLSGGAILLLGPPAALRHASLQWDYLEHPLSRGESAYHYLDRDSNRWPEGEIQVFADYQEMLVDARIEREAAARDAHVPLHLLDELICERRDQRTRRRHERRKLLRRAALGVR